MQREVDAVVSELTRLGLQLDLKAPHAHLQAPAWDRQTFAAWLQDRSAEPETYDYFQVEMAGLFAADSRISAAFDSFSRRRRSTLTGDRDIQPILDDRRRERDAG